MGIRLAVTQREALNADFSLFIISTKFTLFVLWVIMTTQVHFITKSALVSICLQLNLEYRLNILMFMVTCAMVRLTSSFFSSMKT